MNEELKNKIESAKKNETYWNDETMIDDLMKQGYKKEDVNAILVPINTTKSNAVLNFYKSIWFWWGLTTIIYLFLPLESIKGHPTAFINHLAGFVGLFVPYGRYSMLLFELNIFSFIIFIPVMIGAEKFLNKKNIPFFIRILINLLALFIITTMVDFMRFTPFASIAIFLNGGNIGLPSSM